MHLSNRLMVLFVSTILASLSCCHAFATTNHGLSAPPSLLTNHVNKKWKHQVTRSFDSTATSATSRRDVSLNMMVGGAVGGALPSVWSVVAACLGPTLLGFYKSEYGVSYGYGTATALTAWLALQSSVGGWAKWHALALVFYGARLNLHLLYREVCIPKFRDMREKIEKRAVSKGSRIRRTPFILSCAALYAGLATPTLLSSKLLLSSQQPSLLVKFFVVGTWIGFLLGAIGDTTKSYVKSKKGPETLVTSGIFQWLRHPNYTGEIIGWTCNCITSLLLVNLNNIKQVWPLVFLSLASVPGILSVLLAATVNLEVKQRNNYGTFKEYQEWVQNSWIGFSLSIPAAGTSN